MRTMRTTAKKWPTVCTGTPDKGVGDDGLCEWRPLCSFHNQRIEMEVTTFVVRKIEWLNYLPKVIRATNMITREHMVKLDEKFTCV
eukprot:COSAG01_NODE_10028_length_2271_cov_3.372468_1_plen_85_part_10